MRSLLVLLLAIFTMGAAARADDAAAKRALAPTGKLRVVIAVAPYPSALYAVKDKESGKITGVTVDLGRELARRLGVEAEFVPHLASEELRKESEGTWDVTFLAVDDGRKKIVDFGSAYAVQYGTYLVPRGSLYRTLEDVRATRGFIVGVNGSDTLGASNRFANAFHIGMPSVEAAIEALKNQGADAVAMPRDILEKVAPRIPGWRVVEGNFLTTTVAIAVPKNRPEALAYVSAFIDEAKASGLVERAFKAADLEKSLIAPGAKP